jgi:hypothetical protein
MSKAWWENTGTRWGSKTTVGHGVNSQFNAELQKEWIHKETRYAMISTGLVLSGGNVLGAFS